MMLISDAAAAADDVIIIISSCVHRNNIFVAALYAVRKSNGYAFGDFAFVLCDRCAPFLAVFFHVFSERHTLLLRCFTSLPSIFDALAGHMLLTHHRADFLITYHMRWIASRCGRFDATSLRRFFHCAIFCPPGSSRRPPLCRAAAESHMLLMPDDLMIFVATYADGCISPPPLL